MSLEPYNVENSDSQPALMSTTDEQKEISAEHASETGTSALSDDYCYDDVAAAARESTHSDGLCIASSTFPCMVGGYC
jgi:hypothetical protein